MGFESIVNYHEKLVALAVAARVAGTEYESDEDFIDDVTCLALNQLPARYVSHTVDLMFYMPADEQVQIGVAVERAVETAIRYVVDRSDAPRPDTCIQLGAL